MACQLSWLEVTLNWILFSIKGKGIEFFIAAALRNFCNKGRGFLK